MVSAPPFRDPKVARVFAGYPAAMRRKLLRLRTLIFDTAAATDDVGEIDETLKWGEPAYVTAESRAGSTIRIAWKPSQPSQYAMYVNCRTTLARSFRRRFPGVFTYEGNRAVVFERDEVVPVKELRACIALALTYRRTHARR